MPGSTETGNNRPTTGWRGNRKKRSIMRFYRSASIAVSTRNPDCRSIRTGGSLIETSHIEYGPGMKRAGHRSSRIFAGACITDLLPEGFFQTTRVLSLTQRPDLLRHLADTCACIIGSFVNMQSANRSEYTGTSGEYWCTVRLETIAIRSLPSHRQNCANIRHSRRRA